MKCVCFLAMTLFAATMSARGQNCFKGCRDHLSTPLKPSEDLNARIQQSQKVLQSLIGCNAPEFSAKTIDDVTISLSSLKGKVIVVNFWFESCAPCIADLPALNKLASEFKDREVVFVAFGRDADERIKKFLESKTFNYQHISRRYDLSYDYCVIAGWPMNMVIDQKGIVRYIKAGGYEEKRSPTFAYDEMKPVIEKYLKKAKR